MSDTHVGTWLDDHMAVAVGALELARRTRRENDEAPWAEALDYVITELESERDGIRAVMTHLGTNPSRIKQTASWLAEKVGRLKLNDRLLTYSPLSRLEELETLLLGVASLGVMWRSIERVRGDQVIENVDPAHRAQVMEDLLVEIKDLLGRAADEALAPA